MRVETQLLRGAGPAAILSLLESGEKYGYELITLLDAQSEGILAMGQSTLYPLLYNLEGKGMIESRTEIAEETNKPRKYYHLTDKGHAYLADSREQLTLMMGALAKLNLLILAT